jgi:glycosyltransferase involved in cell wall biosynthesis
MTITTLEVSVVVPVHNASASLSELVRRLVATLASATKAYEIVLVDDASVDSSWERTCALAAANGHIRGLRLRRNAGQHPALVAGIRASKSEWIVTLDDDLQHPPECLPALFAAVAPGVELIYGTSPLPDQSLARRLAARSARRLLAPRLGLAGARAASSLRLFRRDLAQRFAELQTGPCCLDLWLAPDPQAIRSVPVNFSARQHLRSGYTPSKLAALVYGLMRRPTASTDKAGRPLYEIDAVTPHGAPLPPRTTPPPQP